MGAGEDSSSNKGEQDEHPPARAPLAPNHGAQRGKSSSRPTVRRRVAGPLYDFCALCVLLRRHSNNPFESRALRSRHDGRDRLGLRERESRMDPGRRQLGSAFPPDGLRQSARLSDRLLRERRLLTTTAAEQEQSCHRCERCGSRAGDGLPAEGGGLGW